MNLASQRSESSIANGNQLKEVNDVPFRSNADTCRERDQSVISYLPFVLQPLLFALAHIGYTEPSIDSYLGSSAQRLWHLKQKLQSLSKRGCSILSSG
jgi:hypothetical protein